MSGPADHIRGSGLWRVLAVYVGASWVVLQVVDVVKDNMGLPDWVFPFAVVLLLIGLPVVLVTAILQARPLVEGGAPDQESGAGSVDGQGDGGQDLSPRRLFTWRNALIGGGLAFLLLGVVTAAFMYMRTAGIGPVGSLVAKGVLEERSRIVLADFGAEDPVLARTVTESFRVDLAQSPVVELVEPDSIEDALARMDRPVDARLDEATARELAVRDGIPAVVAGEINVLGSGYVLTARLVAPGDGAVLASARASARDEAALVEAIDEVSSRLREQIGESYTSLRKTPSLAHVTTSSLEALKKYTQATDARHRDEDPEEAVDLLEEAVAIDSTFALAWRDLSTVLDNLREDRERRIAALEAAYRHRNRLTERERYLVEASYHSDVTEDAEQAIEAYRAMLRLDPDDAQALNNIGVNYFRQADFDNALTWYRRAHEAAPDVSLHLANVAVTHANLGNLDSAAARYAELDSFPANPLWEDYRAHFRWLTGDEEGFREAWERIGEEFPEGRAESRAQDILERLELLHGRVAEAIGREERRAEESLRRDDREEWAEALLSAAWLKLGAHADTTAALATVQAAVGWLEDQPSAGEGEDLPWGPVGWFLLEAGKVDRGLRFLDRAWEQIPERRRQVRGFERATELRARTALVEGRPEDALREFRSLPPETCTPCNHHWTARLFDEAGRADSAVHYYQEYLRAPYNFRFYPDSRWLAETHERLGELYDERGDLENAAVHYARFVELWEDADAELQPRVEAARTRLEEIVRERG